MCIRDSSNINSIFPPFGFTLIDSDSPGLALLHILAIESILSPINSSPSISNLSKELIGNKNSTLEIREGSVPSIYTQLSLKVNKHSPVSSDIDSTIGVTLFRFCNIKCNIKTRIVL